MEKFYLEEPNINRKKEAIEFINEFYEYKSNINGIGRLDKYLDNYEGWLVKLEEDYNRVPSNDRVPSRTYFLVRENDNRIIGMINIRLALNDYLSQHGYHIGYSIRPTERGKGYNLINLYLGLKVCQKYGLEEVMLDADINNIASWKTMEALGGTKVKEYFDEETKNQSVVYKIPVSESIEKYRDKYEEYISKGKVR